jgi:curved DNA-binding protein CbpA
VAKPFYTLLDVAPDAPADDIKRAFRREIAKYHPDKVHHLGQEFQEIAATKAAELTRAYKALIDPVTRAEYDADELADELSSPRPPSPPPAPSATPAASEFAPRLRRGLAAGAPLAFQQERMGANDLVQRATVMRFRTGADGRIQKLRSSRWLAFK